MNYKEFVFTLVSEKDYHTDLLINSLSEIGFDTFEDTEAGFKAYIQSNKFNQSDFDTALKEYTHLFSFSYEVNVIESQNWNEVWESNFEPLIISDQCYVRATFHTPKPEFPYEIIIDPKMAFGTGHHQTTAMMMELMLEENYDGKEILDMGCGTGILAILASKLGAENIIAIDNDEICYESVLENSDLNKIKNIKSICGSKEEIPNKKFDIILANINRNILLDQLDSYKNALSNGGIIFLSGFYEEIDLEMIKKKAESIDLNYVRHKKDQNWVAAKFASNK